MCSTFVLVRLRINRNILECKDETIKDKKTAQTRINRNILECKESLVVLKTDRKKY